MKQILITSWVGDFFAVESFLTTEEKNSIESIYYATRQEENIRYLIKSFPEIFPNLKSQITLFNKFTPPHTSMFCIEHKNQLKSLALMAEANIDDIEDFGVARIGREFMEGSRKYNGSAFLKKEIELKLNLSNSFAFIHPYSDNAPTDLRDFTQSEWNSVLNYLEKNNLIGVVVNQGDRFVPEHKLIYDFTNKTTLIQAIQILKQSVCFIGASSCFSVLASKILPNEKLFIKGHSVLKTKWWSVYYAPQTTNSIIYHTLNEFPELKGEEV